MKFKVTRNDPLKILSSTKFVVEHAKDVEIDKDAVKNLIKPVRRIISKGLEETVVNANIVGKFKDDLQLVFIQDCVNFCFWAEKGREKWQIEYPKGNIVSGGWFGLEACFKRALENKLPLLSADFLKGITIDKVRELFRSSNETIIPLLKERQKNLQEAGRVLKKKFNGEFLNLVDESNFIASDIVKNIVKNFSSFDDETVYKRKKVYFYKRAQITANDAGFIGKKYGKRIKGLKSLAAMADYKLPQILRDFKVLRYSKDLAEKVDNYILIPAGSSEEVEIRASTIWAVELIRQQMSKHSSSQIDNSIWLMSQDQTKIGNPYHRTYTIYY